MLTCCSFGLDGSFLRLVLFKGDPRPSGNSGIVLSPAPSEVTNTALTTTVVPSERAGNRGAGLPNYDLRLEVADSGRERTGVATQSRGCAHARKPRVAGSLPGSSSLRPTPHGAGLGAGLASKTRETFQFRSCVCSATAPGPQIHCRCRAHCSNSKLP